VFVGAVMLLRSHHQRSARHIDAPGIALYGGALILLLATMTAAGQDPALWREPVPWLAVLVSIALVAVFLRYIQRARDPVMDFELVARQPFLAANLYNLFFGAAAFGVSSFIPTYAVTHFGMSPLLSGAVLTPRSISIILTSILASLWLIRLGYRTPMLVGSALVMVMLLLLVAAAGHWTCRPRATSCRWCPIRCAICANIFQRSAKRDPQSSRD